MLLKKILLLCDNLYLKSFNILISGIKRCLLQIINFIEFIIVDIGKR